MYELKGASDPTIKEEILSGFVGGINVFQDESNIKEGELLDGKNILLNIDGISPRHGTQVMGEEKDSRVMGGIGFYKSTGTREMLRFSGTTLQKYVDGTPTDIAGATFSSGYRLELIQVRDKIWIFNGQENLSSYDGSTITVVTPITTPTNLAVAAQGTTGSTAYSYRVSAFNDSGETVACTSVAITNGNKVLSATNFNRLTWTAVTGATGYNIYGRHATGLTELLITSVYAVTTFDDNGSYAYDAELGVDVGQTTLPPEDNSTSGVKGTMCCFWQGRIYTAGDPSNPSRLSFGGVGTNVGNFSLSSVGGGYVDVSLNDGAIIRDILPFQNGIIVWKDNAIYKFSFNSAGSAQLEEITRAFGGISYRGAKHVENDIVFPARKDGRLAFFSLGNQEGYMSTVLRTNELSIKIAPLLTNVNMDKLNFAAAGYFNSLYVCAIPTSSSEINDRIWKLDTRFGAWTYDEGYYPNFFMEYTDDEGVQKYYFGDETSGHMVEMFTNTASDSGVAFEQTWTCKSSNQKTTSKEKRYYDPKFEFKDLSSNVDIEGSIIKNGIVSVGSFNISSTVATGAGIGASLWGGILWGDVEGAAGEVTENNVVKEVAMITEGRSIKYTFTCNTLNASYKFMSITNIFEVLDQKRINSENRIYLES